MGKSNKQHKKRTDIQGKKVGLTVKRKYILCKSQFISSASLKNHLEKLKTNKYKKIIKHIYETYSKKIKNTYVHHTGDYTIEKYNILDRLPDNSAVKSLRLKSRTDIRKEDVMKLLESPDISANNLIFSKFSNIDIIMDLIHNNYQKYSINYEITLPSGKKIRYEIHLYRKGNDNITNMVEYGFGVVRRVLFMNYLLNNNELPSRIDIYLTNFKKALDYTKTDAIGSDSVNSAVTDGQNIVIFREEEAMKCFVHELVHFHCLDKKLYNFSLNNMDVNVLLRRLKLSHNIDLDYNHRLTEAYTECLACVFNCILSTADAFIDVRKNGVGIEQIDHIIKCLDYEIGFSFLQIAKILKYFKYEKVEHLFKLGSNSKIIRKPLAQTTDLFSYYIVKTYLMLNLFDLLDEIIELDSNNKLHMIDVVGYLEDSIEKILDFETLESKILIQGVNRYMAKYKGTKKKNLRMTCLD